MLGGPPEETGPEPAPPEAPPPQEAPLPVSLEVGPSLEELGARGEAGERVEVGRPEEVPGGRPPGLETLLEVAPPVEVERRRRAASFPALAHLTPAQRALVWAEILAPPASLREPTPGAPPDTGRSA